VRAFGGIALRYGLIYGTGATPIFAADWNGLLPLLHLTDAASAAVAALTRGKRGAAYNIADDVATSWAELQQASAIAAGRPMPRAVPAWVLRASAPFAAELIASTSMRLSTANAKRELGWRPQYRSFAEGLRESIEVSTPA
jgi:nucleoside-diphosphate-sugar epimerase